MDLVLCLLHQCMQISVQDCICFRARLFLSSSTERASHLTQYFFIYFVTRVEISTENI